MLKNYLTVALRNLMKYRLYSFINIGGLAMGLACTLLILLWVRDEVSYDRFHEESGSIYRVNWDYKWRDNQGVGPGTPPPLAESLTNDIPEVIAATRVYPVTKEIVRHGDRFFTESRIFGVDGNFFDFFDFKALAGDLETALTEPNKVILTEETARKYFGDEPALGKILSIGEERDFLGSTYQNAFEVTGVLQSLPHNSHLQFDILTSISSHPQVAFFDWSWVWMQVTTYVKLKQGTSSNLVDGKIPALVEKYAPAAFKRIGFSYDELISSGGHWDFVLQPLTDIYLGSASIGNRLGPLGNRLYVYVFSIIAGFLLIIACINFMNLSTARAANRAKEVGVRKALGSQKRRLVSQFLVESTLFSALAMVLALFFTEILIGPFNDLVGKSLDFDLLTPLWQPAALIVLTLLVGLTAGTYPGIYLSSFRPAQVLSQATGATAKGKRMRNALVVFQFAITISLIAGTLLVQEQMNFVQEIDVGYDKEGVVIISNENDRLGNQAEAFKERLKSHSRVINASISTGVPSVGVFEDYYKVEGKEDEQLALVSYLVDEDFVATLGIEILAGRGFSKDFVTDSESVILNETAVETFGWDDPIGKTITYPGKGQYLVIGVMDDFNFQSLYFPIRPFALFHRSSESYQVPNSYIVVRIPRTDVESSVSLLEAEWQAFASSVPFEYKFLDQNFNQKYLSGQRLQKIFLIFSILTIAIACIGLLGLAAFASEQRTKEIGIRKVLGASVPSLVALLSKEFSKWVIWANVIACPIAYFAMEHWLQNFAYRIEIGWWIFFLAGGLALLIALATVSTQAIRAAVSNPVEALHYE